MPLPPLSFALLTFAAVLGFGGFLYIRHAETIKHWKENYALFEFQRQASRVTSVQTYRTIGWLLALCALVMLIAALFFV
jgi:hypothetical protein